MANKLFDLILDLSGSNLVPHIDIRRNDYDSNVFSVQVTQNGLPFDFTGMNPIFECLTPDGHYIRDDGSQYGTIHVVDAAQGKLEYTLVNEVFAALGQIDVAYFAFEQQNADLQNPTNRVSTGNFSMRIIADALTGTTAAADYMSDVTTLIQQINQLKTDYQTLNPANYVTQVDFTNQNNQVTSQLAAKVNNSAVTSGHIQLTLLNGVTGQAYINYVEVNGLRICTLEFDVPVDVQIIIANLPAGYRPQDTISSIVHHVGHPTDPSYDFYFDIYQGMLTCGPHGGNNDLSNHYISAMTYVAGS